MQALDINVVLCYIFDLFFLILQRLNMPVTIKLKASLVRRTAQTLLDTEYDNLVSGRAIIDPTILSRLELIIEMMDEVDPDDLVFVDEEAYAFLTQQ